MSTSLPAITVLSIAQSSAHSQAVLLIAGLRAFGPQSMHSGYALILVSVSHSCVPSLCAGQRDTHRQLQLRWGD